MQGDQRKALYIKDDLGNVIEVTEQDAVTLSWGVFQTLLIDMLNEGMKLAQQQPQVQPAQAQQVVVNVNIDHEKLADAIVRSLSTHALPQATPMVIESSTHENIKLDDASVSEDDLMYIDGMPYLKNNAQTWVPGHKQTQAKRANKAKGGGVSYTPDTLCLDAGFRQCVEVEMSKAKLAEKFGVSESTVARAKRMLKTGE